MTLHTRLLASTASFVLALILALLPRDSVEARTSVVMNTEGRCTEGGMGEGGGGPTAHEFDPPWSGGACYKAEWAGYHQSTEWNYCHEDHISCSEQ